MEFVLNFFEHEMDTRVILNNVVYKNLVKALVKYDRIGYYKYMCNS